MKPSAERGGDLGWLHRGSPQVPHFMSPLFRAEVGEDSLSAFKADVDLGDQAPGAYRLRLLDDAGAPLRDTNGQPLTVADHDFYLDGEAAAAAAA